MISFTDRPEFSLIIFKSFSGQAYPGNSCQEVWSGGS